MFFDERTSTDFPRPSHIISMPLSHIIAAFSLPSTTTTTTNHRTFIFFTDGDSAAYFDPHSRASVLDPSMSLSDPNGPLLRTLNMLKVSHAHKLCLWL